MCGGGRSPTLESLFSGVGASSDTNVVLLGAQLLNSANIAVKISSTQPEAVTHVTITHRCIVTWPDDWGWNVWTSHNTDLLSTSLKSVLWPEMCSVFSRLKPGTLERLARSASAVLETECTRSVQSSPQMECKATWPGLVYRLLSSDCSCLANLQQHLYLSTKTSLSVRSFAASVNSSWLLVGL